MAKKDKERERRRKQEQWERENAQITDTRRLAPRMKRDLRAKGCVLPFYETLDAYEEEFHRVVAWAKSPHHAAGVSGGEPQPSTGPVSGAS